MGRRGERERRPRRGRALSEAAPAAPLPAFALDHLVVAAGSLEAGRAWSRRVLGVEPSPGGRHAFMGTHNLLVATASARFPRSYLEIIAIDPAAPAPQRKRWFDLDDPALQARIAAGPRLVHWVARCGDIEAGAAWLRAAGHEVGRPAAAERMTEGGLLRWRIALRDDGGRPADGAVPLLIAWGGRHPADAMPDAGVRLERLALGGIAPALAAALGADAAHGGAAAPSIAAGLVGPGGPVQLG